MCFQVVGLKLESCFGTCNQSHHDGVRIDPSPAHEHEMNQGDSYSGKNSLEPDCYREEPKEDDEGNDDYCRPND